MSPPLPSSAPSGASRQVRAACAAALGTFAPLTKCPRADGEVATAPELPMGSARAASRAPGPPPRASLVALPSAPVGPPAE